MRRKREELKNGREVFNLKAYEMTKKWNGGERKTLKNWRLEKS